MNTSTKNRGFSIIEVVLVLAIAALIFLMVFIALPALQKGQRDTARKQDANTIAAALGTYRSNHSGKMPGTSEADLTSFRDKYITNLSQIELDNVVFGDNDDIEEDDFEKVVIEMGRQCDPEDNEAQGKASSRAAAIRVRLESSNDVVCTDS